MTNSVTHFEIYAEEPAKLAEFYRALLGWQSREGAGNRLLAHPDRARRLQRRQRRDAAAADPRAAQLGALRPRRVARQTLEQLLALGGSVVRPKAAVPKTAWYAVVADPDGNIFALWQADPLAMPAPEPED